MAKNKIMTIKIPKKACADCYFSTYSGNYEEDYCGLYMKYTGTDGVEENESEFIMKKQAMKPDFCVARQVEIPIREDENERK